MKLTTKIAGSMVLPLALAVAANSAQAFTVVDNDDHKITIGGYLSAITSWHKGGSKTTAPTTHKFNNDFSAGTSRLNLGYTDKATGTKFFYEQQFVGGLGGGSNGLRHAYFETADGLVGGYTWSFGTNNVARIESIDIGNNSLVTDQAGGPRNLLLGQRFTVADGMTVGVSLENQNKNTNGITDYHDGAQKSVLPAVTANFDGQFGDARVFAAWTNYAVNVDEVNAISNDSGKDKRANRITFGTSIDAGAANIKLGLTHNFGVKYEGDQELEHPTVAEGTHLSAGLGFKVNEKVRTNLAVEHSIWDKETISKKGDGKSNGKATRVWLNAFYQADNGIEWGAEYQYADIDAGIDNGLSVDRVNYGSVSGALADKGQAIRLQAKYAF